jgi:hypothetical protein
MLIENMDTKETWDSVVLYLKPSEAKELRDSLNAIINDQTPGRHEHVSNEDYKREITILISDKE